MRRLLLGLSGICLSLAASGVLIAGPAAGQAAQANPVSRVVAWLQALPQQVIIDGHCQLVDANGVPLYDSLYWQRTGHDPC